jgi:hypothetical protein
LRRAISDWESNCNQRPSEDASALKPSQKLSVILCPGFHDAQLTAQFGRSLPPFTCAHIVEAFPANPWAVFDWLQQSWLPKTGQASPANAPALVAIGFSAGAVGLAGALKLWQQQGGKVSLFLALDGWGVPAIALPVYRLSHDYLTHWSSLPLGAGPVNFYADPPVEHLQLWGAPEQVSGWQIRGSKADSAKTPMSAATFLRQRLYAAWLSDCQHSL